METIEVLISEKKVLRDEILTIKRIIYSSLFSIITILGVVFAYLLGKDGFDGFLNNKLYEVYSLIISQIEFIVAIFILSLDSTVITLSAYISILDDKLNEQKHEKIAIWESHRRLFNTTAKGPEFYCFVIIYSFFIILFLGCVSLNAIRIFQNFRYFYFVFLIVQIIEMLIVTLIALKKHKEFFRVRESFAEEMNTILTPTAGKHHAGHSDTSK